MVNGTARWIMAIMTAVGLTFGVCSWAFYANLKPKVETLQRLQSEDHTEIQLLKQTLDRIDTTVQKIHRLLYKPETSLFWEPLIVAPSPLHFTENTLEFCLPGASIYSFTNTE